MFEDEESDYFDKLAQFLMYRKISLKTPNGFTQRFTVQNGKQLYQIIKLYASYFEVHMSVQQYDAKDTAFNWTMVFDIDGTNIEEACKQICALLDHFDIFYLVDTRYHIWIPNWQTRVLSQWNSYFGEKAKYIALYVETVCNLQRYGCTIDKHILSTQNHLIRSPYSPHLETKSIQKFFKQPFKSNETMNIDEALAMWNGTSLTSETIAGHQEKFAQFVKTAVELGWQIDFMLNMEKYKLSYQQKPMPKVKEVAWMEKLLKTSIPKGYRHYTLWLVLTPYMACKTRNVKEAVEELERWLKLSNADEIDDRDLYWYAREHYLYCVEHEIKPISKERLKERFPELYRIFEERGVFV
jgi:hypothetical protein